MRASRARTRCRVDLAGGTLDIWPLGLMHPGARTVNFAIDLEVEVRVEPLVSGYRVRSGDGSAIEAESLDDLAHSPEASLAAVALAWLQAPPLAVSIRSASPRGAGLGASSAITVALLSATRAALGLEALDVLALARVARDLEARLMSLPTGAQDHLPALLGGALEIVQQPGGIEVQRLATDLDELSRTLLVAYTGVSHFSAGNNWGIVRRRLDGDADVTARLSRISDVAAAMAKALRTGDLALCGRLMSEEWEARRGLSPGVSTPEVEAILAAAKSAGAWGGKACGAGGGGCVAVLAPPESRQAVHDACVSAGAQPLPARPTALGLELE